MIELGAKKSAVWDEQLERLSDNQWVKAAGRFFRNKTAVAALVVFLAIVLGCMILPFFSSEDPYALDLTQMRQPPSRQHIFGTDGLGRDFYVRILYGGRITLGIMAVATIIAAVVGSAIGMCAGFYGGKVDFVLMRLTDVIAAVPGILLAVMIEVAMGIGRGYFKYGIAIAAMPPFARLLRATVMNIVKSEYIEASRALGASDSRIMLKHILHNVAAPMMIQVLSCAAETLLNCTIMGYLEIGISPPIPEWGGIVNDMKDLMRAYPFLTLIPSGVIVLTEMSMHFIGSGLRDALDPGGNAV